ncbi:hypothetical protein [Saccharothrix sp.]|uniref:hypothetical protein n=1 Tax=Saccharothrix sp. TaxID=1873460 RepID=UPI0028122397|nr:hypothetical protein [Saccharothrix sp.]
MSTQYGDADLTPPQGFARPEDPDGFTVAPAVIGGDLPPAGFGAEPAPVDPVRESGQGGFRQAGEQPEEPPKRSFFGRLLRRNG